MSITERFDAVIIGAGMSGLAAGIRLAQFDQRVLIVEKHALWGGLNSFYKLGGHHFDVGLHALTNYVGPRVRGTPLARVLRQLRISHADLQLGQQSESRIAFPDVSLRLSNDFELLCSEIERAFPSQRDGFARLLRDVASYPDITSAAEARDARLVLRTYFSDELLIDMLLLPVCYYGSPVEHGVDWNGFVILFKSLYEEGFARPRGGVRTILDLLRARYKELGGELRMRSGVERIEHDAQGVQSLVLAGGDRIACERVLSSAGYVETLGLCGTQIEREHVAATDVGRLSFVESISLLSQPIAELGHDATITFFNAADSLVYARPAGAVDLRSGVICCPENYAGQEDFGAGVLRLTLLANYDIWTQLDDADYYALKDEVWDQGHAAITPFAPDIRPLTTFKDIFTPRTIEHFTGHRGGAVYGSPRKHRSGATPVPGLFLCGTDQGYLGIVGAMLSGISMANKHCLMPV
jgi:phytoene dehydrogenase-like protein